MQFAPNTPDIPDNLIQAHQEGRVVFFCGAGISYNAGLPGFKDLVSNIYSHVGERSSKEEQTAFEACQYDTTLQLLELRLQEGRRRVRHALFDSLQPNLKRARATAYHKALLELAKTPAGQVRLVTTNFDQVFERVIRNKGLKINTYKAPMIPVPKPSRWDGLVYLHGLLPKALDETELASLVATSGDFGLAYLTERWAARFVSELFKNYVVCFVGYSLNDPVLRYIVDALAADRLQGEASPEAYVFGGYEPGKVLEERDKWTAKGVVPILYETPTSDNHGYLLSALSSWADTYKAGLTGKKQVASTHAALHPSGSTKQDNFVERLIWALSDRTGLPARAFAEHDPVASLDWLEEFSKPRFRAADLSRFDVTAELNTNTALEFSFINRPAQNSKAQWMSLVSHQQSPPPLDSIMLELSNWLLRHLNDPKLAVWLSQRGNRLHPALEQKIGVRLEKISNAEKSGDVASLDRFRRGSPMAIPTPAMKVLWRLLLMGHMKSGFANTNLYSWNDKLKAFGVGVYLRAELRTYLAPRIVLRERTYSSKTVPSAGRVRDVVDWELKLNSDFVDSWWKQVKRYEAWNRALPTLFEDFQITLQDTMYLLEELGDANESSDTSVWVLPSIYPHSQNQNHDRWGILIQLLRDSWLALGVHNKLRAQYAALQWFEMPFPVFKRLAIFAAGQEGYVCSSDWLSWITSNDGRWLWSIQTRREVLRLLELQGKSLSVEEMSQLEKIILQGPSKDIYFDETDFELSKVRFRRNIWLYMKKLQSGGAALSSRSECYLQMLETKYPSWKLSNDHREEFAIWSGGSDNDEMPGEQESSVPRKRLELIKWLQNNDATGAWSDFCRDRFYVSASALCSLSKDQIWPVERWREALYAWSDKSFSSKSWKYLAPLVAEMPSEAFGQLPNAIASWLNKASVNETRHGQLLIEIGRRVLESQSTSGVQTDDLLMEAINHPCGLVVDAFINHLFSGNPNDNDQLPERLVGVFNEIVNPEASHFFPGRLMLATRLLALFRVDPTWTREKLIPLFDWDRDLVQARGVWTGFLWSPRINPPLLVHLKSNLLETASRYEQLGAVAEQYATLLSHIGLSPQKEISLQELQSAISKLPPAGIEQLVTSLMRRLEAAGDKREEFWRERVKPFWHQCWPKSQGNMSERISEMLVLLVIEAGDELPDALHQVKDWIIPIKSAHYAIHKLNESGLVAKHPEASLKLLSRFIDDESWLDQDVEACLESIVGSQPSLSQSSQFIQLRTLLEQRRGSS